MNSPPGYISKGNEIIVLKMHLNPYVHCSIIHNSQDIETTYEWIKKKKKKKKEENMVYRNNRIFFNHKKEGNSAILTTWMKL